MSEQSTIAPAVSNTANITSGVKEKDPRRVAAGKRLGTISWQAKEAKRLEREKQSQAQDVTGNGYTLYFVGGIVVVGTLSYLYLNKIQLKKLTNRGDAQPQGGNEPKTPQAKKKSNRVFANE